MVREQKCQTQTTRKRKQISHARSERRKVWNHQKGNPTPRGVGVGDEGERGAEGDVLGLTEGLLLELRVHLESNRGGGRISPSPTPLPPSIGNPLIYKKAAHIRNIF